MFYYYYPTILRLFIPFRAQGGGGENGGNALTQNLLGLMCFSKKKTKKPAGTPPKKQKSRAASRDVLSLNRLLNIRTIYK